MKNITIYTGPRCNYCDAAKRLLIRNNATYNEIDISKVEGALDENILGLIEGADLVLYDSTYTQEEYVKKNKEFLMEEWGRVMWPGHVIVKPDKNK